jgi:integrase
MFDKIIAFFEFIYLVSKYGLTETEKRVNDEVHRLKMDVWKVACEKAGIKINQKNAIRHSLGCQLLDNGVDLEMVRDIYGHTSTDMTRKYVKRTPTRMLEALKNRGQIIELEDLQRNKIKITSD